jgi:hypothetical protein
MAARMGMMGGPGMGGPGMGPAPPKRGPVPPPKPPPRSPPGGGRAEEEFMQMMMKMRSGRSDTGLPSGRAQEELLMRAYENMSRGRSPRRDRRYRCVQPPVCPPHSDRNQCEKG